MVTSTMSLVRPLSTECQSWFTENVHYEDYQVIPHGFAPSIAVEPRMARDILEGMREEGFEEGKDFEVNE